MKKKVFTFCTNEVKKNKSLYFDTKSGEINPTILAENFINLNKISHKNEDEIFDLVVDWCEANNF